MNKIVSTSIVAVILLTTISAGCLEQGEELVHEFIEDFFPLDEMNELSDNYDDNIYGTDVAPDPDNPTVSPTPPTNLTNTTEVPSDDIPSDTEIMINRSYTDTLNDVEIYDITDTGSYYDSNETNKVWTWAHFNWEVDVNQFDLSSSTISENEDSYVLTINSVGNLVLPEVEYNIVGALGSTTYFGEKRVIYVTEVYVQSTSQLPDAHVVIMDYKSNPSQMSMVRCFITTDTDYLSDSVTNTVALPFNITGTTLSIDIPQTVFNPASAAFLWDTTPEDYNLSYFKTYSWVIGHFRNPLYEAQPLTEYGYDGIYIFDVVPNTYWDPLTRGVEEEETPITTLLSNNLVLIGSIAVVVVALLVVVLIVKKRPPKKIDIDCPSGFEYDENLGKCVKG